MQYLACYLQVKLFGLRDNLGGIELRDSDGREFDPSVGEPSRKDWYNKRTGRLYISHFKTQGSAKGRPYDFQLPPDMRATVDATLAPDAPQARRKYLVNIGVGGEGAKRKPGLPSAVGPVITAAFKKVGFLYKQVDNKGNLKNMPPGILDNRHSQVVYKYKEWKRKHPTWTDNQISDDI